MKPLEYVVADAGLKNVVAHAALTGCRLAAQSVASLVPVEIRRCADCRLLRSGPAPRYAEPVRQGSFRAVCLAIESRPALKLTGLMFKKYVQHPQGVRAGCVICAPETVEAEAGVNNL